MKNIKLHQKSATSPKNLQLLDLCGLEMLRELEREKTLENLKKQRQILKG